MRSVLALFIVAALGCATHPELGGGPPRSQALQQAVDDLMCAEESLLTQVLEGYLLVSGCGTTAAYLPEGGVWTLRLKFRDSGWILRRALLEEDVAVFARAVEDLRCGARDVVLQREFGIRVARGCGFRRAYAVVCGDELHELDLDGLPKEAAADDVRDLERIREDVAAGRAVPFGDQMTPPKRLCGRQPVFSNVSLHKRIAGVAIIRCVLTEEGYVDGCRVIQPLEYHTEILLDALYSHRYQPATFEGKPAKVDYVFNFRMMLP